MLRRRLHDLQITQSAHDCAFIVQSNDRYPRLACVAACGRLLPKPAVDPERALGLAVLQFDATDGASWTFRNPAHALRIPSNDGNEITLSFSDLAIRAAMGRRRVAGTSPTYRSRST